MIPLAKDEDEEEENVPAKSPKGKSKVPSNVAAAKSKIPEVTISPEAQPDIKKAVEVIFSPCIGTDPISLYQDFTDAINSFDTNAQVPPIKWSKEAKPDFKSACEVL